VALIPPPVAATVYRHSRGIPRLINTVCENALISAFARQAISVSPEAVEEVAADLRLGVVYTPAAPATKQNQQDALQAMKTLLQLHEYLQSMRSPEVDSRSAITSTILPGVIKQ
jgi:hypothetical protein